jgi:hypothetical protein
MTCQPGISTELVDGGTEAELRPDAYPTPWVP